MAMSQIIYSHSTTDPNYLLVEVWFEDDFQHTYTGIVSTLKHDRMIVERMPRDYVIDDIDFFFTDYRQVVNFG